MRYYRLAMSCHSQFYQSLYSSYQLLSVIIHELSAISCQLIIISGLKFYIYFIIANRMHKYDIIDVIDEGAYGIVWKALNKQTNSLVAIKEFKEGDEDEFSKKTIQREIKMLKMLKSDYVVGIKEAFKKKGKIYLIFQFFQKNLLNLIEKFETGLEPHLINGLIYKIIKCLQYLHSKNIIHRDIKPENLLLNHDYTVLKICDFGFARFLPDKEYDLTQYVATRWYRSPELLVGEPYGKAADLWAIGCMIGQLVDGQPMFPGDDEIDQIHIINKTIGDLTEVQKQYFHKNTKFSEVQLSEVKRKQSIQTRYLGKIQKNALSFMKACLKMNPSQRITIEQALKHPYLIKFSLEDNEFHNDEQNLLNYQRKVIPMKNQSKASLISIKDDDERQKINLPLKTKFFNNNKQGLKFQGGSIGEKDTNKVVNEFQTTKMDILPKKKSHTNLQALKYASISPEQKKQNKKMKKMMSQQKSIKVNVDFNVKINLKINEKLQKIQKKEKRQTKDMKQHIQSKLNINHNNLIKNKLLPEIKNNSKGMRYQLNIRHQRINQLISVVGQSKQLVKGSKNQLHQ